VGKEVNHIDGNKQNAAVGNLEYITHDENMTHAAETNLISSGDGHWSRRRAALRGELPVPPAMAEAGS